MQYVYVSLSLSLTHAHTEWLPQAQYQPHYNYCVFVHYPSSSFYLKHLWDWSLPLSSGKRPTQLGLITGVSPYLLTSYINWGQLRGFLLGDGGRLASLKRFK
jgi:hypothetical protein